MVILPIKCVALCSGTPGEWRRAVVEGACGFGEGGTHRLGLHLCGTTSSLIRYAQPYKVNLSNE